MRMFFAPIICILLFWSCSNSHSPNVAVDEQYNAKFDSFLTQFAQFDGKQLDESFFRVRKQFPNEKLSPIIDRYYFSFLLPYDEECNCNVKELYYRPCCKIERKNYYLVAMEVCCDITKTPGYPYDDNALVTYDKKGNMVDFVTVGTGSDLAMFKIEPSTGEYEIVYTQYSFKDIESVYDSCCDVSVYKVTVDEDGRMGKSLLCEEKSVKVVL